jgi:hypothetical protein
MRVIGARRLPSRALPKEDHGYVEKKPAARIIQAFGYGIQGEHTLARRIDHEQGLLLSRRSRAAFDPFSIAEMSALAAKTMFDGRLVRVLLPASRRSARAASPARRTGRPARQRLRRP